MTARGTADLRWTSRPAHAEAVVLVLHGGAETSDHEVRWRDLAVLRLLPFARAARRAGGSRLAVARLRFAVKGWNGTDARPLHDARWALQQVRAAYPGLPVGVVGHSMGGRVALQVAGDDDIRAVVALAPWVHQHDAPRGRPGTAVLVLHGADDRITSPRASEEFVQRLRAQGVDATFEEDPGEGHALIRHARAHHRRAATWLRDRLLPGPEPARTS